jgi:uncharacterized repeat protein (TIGR03837 family)
MRPAPAPAPAPAVTRTPSPPPPPLLWVIFCRVVDNFGDLGVCWRLARGLAQQGQRVRLWVDDAAALAWMAPAGHPHVEVKPWALVEAAAPAPGEVVVETFGCDPPAHFVAAMAAQARPPVWINLEYLSAEAYVERSHRLRSPQCSGPGAGLDKWFFYPGFTPATGGLLREPGLIEGLDAVAPAAVLAARGVTLAPGERCVSVFCYAGAPLAPWVQALSDQPVCLLSCPGAATDTLRAMPLPARMRLQPLPWLSQLDYDHLLRACDLNVVRGEDSFVRAQWAARPFVWHIYPQDDGAHRHKLDAFLSRHLAGAPAPLAATIRQSMLAWNTVAAPEQGLRSPWAQLDTWAEQTRRWRQQLWAQTDLIQQLFQFVAEKR